MIDDGSGAVVDRLPAYHAQEAIKRCAIVRPL